MFRSQGQRSFILEDRDEGIGGEFTILFILGFIVGWVLGDGDGDGIVGS